ncbi:alpha-hemoglobin-stabilizing protein isoform X2 [Cervus elaphus]|uniref:alpha-hemoglobin-stabilizing protein isoform X2 n=1 Tax=Cervus canadensis TaxID=1574408 RepID=UPI001CA350C2|nr:alpha-hemoglobin-stabilizing protein isoform X2 [Cervus canadensis]XP_043770775.1 alpha-hemoglobin-stabilizing protein isoform X2 [Cervus elaphus]
MAHLKNYDCYWNWPNGSIYKNTYFDLNAGRFPLWLTLDPLSTSSLAQRDSQRLKSVAETYTAPLDPKMALIQTNKDLISKGIKEFNALLNQQVFTDPAVSEEAMVTVVNDWVSFYINYYKKQMSGEQAEQDKALQEFRQELDTLSASFLDKYRDFLKSS